MNRSQALITALLLIGAAGAWLIIKDSDEPKTKPETQVERVARPNSQKARETRWPKLTDHRLPLETRLNVARSIDRSLSAREYSELFALMRHQPKSGDESEWWVVLNEIMEQMRKHGAGAEQYTATLSAILADPSMPEVPRDYAAQHLAQWIAPANTESPGEIDPARRQEALSLFGDIIADESLTHTAIPGTALMALTDAASRLAEEETTSIWEKLDPVLIELITGVRSAEMTLRVSAIQSAALRQSEQHLPGIRAFANNEKANPSLRLSSIAALGLYADPEDRETLTDLANSKTKFQYAAKAALERF